MRAGTRVRDGRATASVVGVLGLAHLAMTAAAVSHGAYLTAIAVFASVCAGVAGVKMWRDNCFESRLLALLVAGGTLVGQVLMVTVGLPGEGPAPWDAMRLMLVVPAAAVLALLVWSPRAAEHRERPRSV